MTEETPADAGAEETSPEAGAATSTETEAAPESSIPAGIGGHVVNLPCGALLPDGTVHRDAEVVKMPCTAR